MKIYFLNPPFLPKYSRQSRSPSVTKSDTVYYNYYACYAASWCEKHGHEIRIQDSIINEWKPYQAIEDIERFYSINIKPNKESKKLIVIETSTASIDNDLFICKTIKDNFPDSKIVLIGTFPSNEPNYCLENDWIDYVAISEYDNTILELANAIEKGEALDSVNGLAFRVGNKCIFTGSPNLLTEKQLDEMPFISEFYLMHYGREKIEKYFYASTNFPMLMILTARGCYWNCSFCNIPMKKSYRARSIPNVIAEFKFIQEKMPWVNEIMVEDDTFNQNRKRTLELCSAMIDEGIKIPWSCNARVTTEFEVLEMMSRAGCRLTCVGFESATQEILDGIEKRSNIDQQYKFMDIANKVGLKVNGCFIFGLPEDTSETMTATIEMAKKLNPNSAQFYPLQVYPGTDAYKWAEKNNFLRTKNFREWITPEGLHSTVVERPGLSSKQVLEWCNKARLEFYKNPRYLRKMVVDVIFDPIERQRIFRASKVLIPHLVNHAKER